MELQKLQRVVVDALEDIKAQDIKVFNTVGQSDMFDRVVVATGNSNRQTRALAWHVVQKVKEAGGAVTSVEGTDPGEWVLVDLGDIVVHLMQPGIRQYYSLEEMWGTKPVRIKLAAERRPSLAPSVDEAPAGGRRHGAAQQRRRRPRRPGRPQRRKRRKAPKKKAKSASKAPAKRAATAKTVGATPTRKSGAKGAAKGATKAATKATTKGAKRPNKAPARTARTTARPPAKAAKATRTAAARRRSASR